ncbi:cobalamin B12-binding domain-containing protein [Nocardia sp. NPDC058633]|uniref:cobalamin B12-binding domain-containing protein n=1 Tax=Nocardia sp. NPDC058633 TaxID=3346568 RepID=UPI0036479262
MRIVDESRDDQQRPVMVTGVISDSHTWNLVFLQLFLEERGYPVVNIGPCVPERLLVEECRRHRPALVVVSSVNGHGYQDGMRMIGPLREQFGTAELPVVIGGKLGIRGDQRADERGTLTDAGFTAVFDDSAEGLVEFDRVLESLWQSVRA